MKRIPIKAAREISERYDQDQVIVITWDKKTGLTHVVTYGKTLADCQQACDGANKIKREILRWPEELCNTKPKRVR